MTVQDTIRARAKELLESGEVATFIGWEAGRFENQTTPLVISDAADADAALDDCTAVTAALLEPVSAFCFSLSPPPMNAKLKYASHAITMMA